MKTSEILRLAAQLMEIGSVCPAPDCGFCCCAISSVTREEASYLAAKAVLSDYFFNEATWWNEEKTPENQSLRILALCMAAAIAESEGL